MKMSRTLIALAGVIALPALAQSSVTLYGVFDIGVNVTDNNNGSRLVSVRSGNTLTSRIGLRGTEDIGGGLSAGFNLESTVSGDTGGSGTPFWGRQSWVSLSQKGVGTLRAGRQLPIISDVFAPYGNSTFFGSQAAPVDGSTAVAGSTAARFNNFIGGTRLDNTLKLTTESFGGLRGMAMLSAGEGVGIGRTESVAATYSPGTIDIGVAYHRTRCLEATCPSTKGDDTVVAVGANWRFSATGRAGAFYSKQENAKNVRNANADVLSLLVVYPIQQWTVLAGYQALNDRTALNQDISQVNLGLKYSLSRRTELYTLYSRQSVDNRGRASMFSEISSDGQQSQFNVGVRHSF